MNDIRDELIARILTAGLDTQDAELRAALDADAELERECRELLGFEAELRARETTIAEDIAAAEDFDAGPFRVSEQLAALARQSGDAPDSSGSHALESPQSKAPFHLLRGGTPLLAAAALLCLAWLGWARPWESEPAGYEHWDDETPLSGPEIVTDPFPVGPASSFEEFRWTAEPGSWSQFIVLVTRPDGSEVAVSKRLNEPLWRPENPSDFPDEIVWRVIVIDSGNLQRPCGAIEASR